MGPPKMPNEVGFLGSGASQSLRAAFATSKTSRHVVLAEPRREPLSLFPASYTTVILIENAFGISAKAQNFAFAKFPFRTSSLWFKKFRIKRKVYLIGSLHKQNLKSNYIRSIWHNCTCKCYL